MRFLGKRFSVNDPQGDVVLLHRKIAAAIGGSALGLVAALASASPAMADVTIPFHQADQLPISATDPDFNTGESCAGVPSDKDGWHFVLPDNDFHFTSLTVAFDSGTPITIDDFSTFGNPVGKHAYVASDIGAELTSASATVAPDDPNDEGTTPKPNFFNLSHTCPGKPSTSPETPGTETPSTHGTETPTTPGEVESTTPAGEMLPKTGSGFPVGPAALLAVILLAAGTTLLATRGVIQLPHRRRH